MFQAQGLMDSYIILQENSKVPTDFLRNYFLNLFHQ